LHGQFSFVSIRGPVFIQPAILIKEFEIFFSSHVAVSDGLADLFWQLHGVAFRHPGRVVLISSPALRQHQKRKGEAKPHRYVAKNKLRVSILK